MAIRIVPEPIPRFGILPWSPTSPPLDTKPHVNQYRVIASLYTTCLLLVGFGVVFSLLLYLMWDPIRGITEFSGCVANVARNTLLCSHRRRKNSRERRRERRRSERDARSCEAVSSGSRGNSAPRNRSSRGGTPRGNQGDSRGDTRGPALVDNRFHIGPPVNNIYVNSDRAKQRGRGHRGRGGRTNGDDGDGDEEHLTSATLPSRRRSDSRRSGRSGGHGRRRTRSDRSELGLSGLGLESESSTGFAGSNDNRRRTERARVRADPEPRRVSIALPGEEGLALGNELARAPDNGAGVWPPGERPTLAEPQSGANAAPAENVGASVGPTSNRDANSGREAAATESGSLTTHQQWARDIQELGAAYDASRRGTGRRAGRAGGGGRRGRRNN